MLFRNLNSVSKQAGLFRYAIAGTRLNATKPSFIQSQLLRRYKSDAPRGGSHGIGVDLTSKKWQQGEEQQLSITEILEREIHDESAELNQQLSTDQFPGFSVETDDADVKLTKQIGDATVSVRFTVSSSLSEWTANEDQDKDVDNQGENYSSTLVSMPEFQVQISKNGQTLEFSCYFEEMDSDEESGEALSGEPVFNIDELVLYQGEPKETEFAVSAEYFQEDLQTALLQYLADHGVDDAFAKNLVQFSTSYEKKQYIGLMKRLKSFVSK